MSVCHVVVGAQQLGLYCLCEITALLFTGNENRLFLSIYCNNTMYLWSFSHCVCGISLFNVCAYLSKSVCGISVLVCSQYTYMTMYAVSICFFKRHIF